MNALFPARLVFMLLCVCEWVWLSSVPAAANLLTFIYSPCSHLVWQIVVWCPLCCCVDPVPVLAFQSHALVPVRCFPLDYILCPGSSHHLSQCSSSLHFICSVIDHQSPCATHSVCRLDFTYIYIYFLIKSLLAVASCRLLWQ